MLGKRLGNAAVVLVVGLGTVAAQCPTTGTPDAGPLPVSSTGCGTVTTGGAEQKFAINGGQTKLLLLNKVLNRSGCGFFHPHAIKALAVGYEYSLNADTATSSTLTARVNSFGLDPDQDEYRSEFETTRDYDAARGRGMTSDERAQIRVSVLEQVKANQFGEMTFTATDLETLSGTGTAPVDINLAGATSTVTMTATATRMGDQIIIDGTATIDGRPHGIPSGSFADCIDPLMDLKMHLVLDKVEQCTSEQNGVDAGPPFVPMDFPEPSDCTEPRYHTVDTALNKSAADVLLFRCGGCHGEQPKLGATVSLHTWAALHKDTQREPGVPLFDAILPRMAVDAPAEIAMPPTEDLTVVWDKVTAEELRVVQAWVSAGACGQADARPAPALAVRAPRGSCGTIGFDQIRTLMDAQEGAKCLNCHTNENPAIGDFSVWGGDGGVVRNRHPLYVGRFGDGGVEQMYLWQAALERMKDHSMGPGYTAGEIAPTPEHIALMQAWVDQGFPECVDLVVAVETPQGTATNTPVFTDTQIPIVFTVATDIPGLLTATVGLSYGSGTVNVSPADIPLEDGTRCRDFDGGVPNGSVAPIRWRCSYTLDRSQALPGGERIFNGDDYLARVTVRRQTQGDGGIVSVRRSDQSDFPFAVGAGALPPYGTDLRYESSAIPANNVGAFITTTCAACHAQPQPDPVHPGVPQNFRLDTYGTTEDGGKGGVYSRRLRIRDNLTGDTMPPESEDGGPARPVMPQNQEDLVIEWINGGAPR